MDNASDINNIKSKMKCKGESDASESDDESWDSEDDDETIARIQRAHFAQTAAMNRRRRPPPKPRPMSQKRKMEAVKSFHDFTKKLKKDTGISIRSLPGNEAFGYNGFSSSEDNLSDSDGLSEEEFEVDPQAVQELNEENESYLDPFTGDIIESKVAVKKSDPLSNPVQNMSEPPKTLTISDIINEGDLDLSKNVEIAEVEQGELCSEKTAEDLLDLKQDENSEDFDITDKLKEMGEINVTPIKEEGEEETSEEQKPDDEDEKKVTNALNMRRNIRDVMDEKQLDASTLAAQRQESERLARVQEQQRIIREVQRQIAINRQNKVHQKTLQLLQGGSSLLKKNATAQKLGLPNTVLVKLPSGETRKTVVHPGSEDATKLPGPSVGLKVLKPDEKSEKKEVVEIVDSSSGEETSSSSSDSDDCIMLSDSEVPASPEAEEDPGNSGLHVNDTYNIPDEQGRVQINIGHPENEEDIFLAPQIARIIKPHQIGGVRFLFDNIIESVGRFSNSTGFGCILAHSMGLGKTLQIVCFTDIFLRHTNSKTVLCIMPINTLQNWVAEFNMWLPIDATISPLSAHGDVRPRTFQIYVLNDSHKTLQMRAKVVKDWATTGGVLMIGYELYRLLSMKKDKKPRKKKKAEIKAEEKEREEKLKNEKVENDDTQGSDSTKLSEGSKLDDTDKPLDDSKDDKKDDINDEEKKLLDEMYEALVKPGPDLVICDEGHRIKNSHSNISYALKQMRTKRRVVLTGYPLQNNLLEYWCMVDFVRPNYLGSKTEFCNMFERPIQNGQCIDSTPQDIRLMRYRAHVLHSLLVGFVQRRSHAVLQSTLPQKAEYVLLVRMTPLQRKLYDRFMNEVVRSTSVPNPLKAFAICCKIWNHPDVLYNFLRKRSEASALIEEDLDLEEIGGVTKAGRAARNKQPKRAYKTRGAAKKPAATIQPTTSASAPKPPTQEATNATNYPNSYPPYGPPGHQQRPDQPGTYPSQSEYQNQPGYPGYQNPPNQPYNQNYGNNYYHQQHQPPYAGYPNQYPTNAPDPNPSYNQNYWGNSNYYGNQDYYSNQPYPNNQAPQDYRNNGPQEYRNNAPPVGYNNPQQQYPQSYQNQISGDPTYQGNTVQPYRQNQDSYANQQRPSNYSQNSQSYQNHQGYPPPVPYPSNQPQNYSNQPYPNSYSDYNSYNPQYDARANYNYPNNMDNQATVQSTSSDQPGPSQSTNNAMPSYPQSDTKENILDTNNMPHSASTGPYGNSAYSYNQSNTYPNQSEPNYMAPYNNFPPHLETKPPLGSGSPLPTWPLSDALKLDVDKIKTEKAEIKTESDTEVKIEDLDTKTIFEDHKEIKKEVIKPNETETKPEPVNKDVSNKKSDDSDSGDDKKKNDNNKGKDSKKVDSKKNSKVKAKRKKDRKTSKDGSDSEEHSEKEDKPNREEEMAIVKKAEEDTYDWAAELLKEYIPGIIENSAKMELFFLILNESILLGDRLLLFSQSLFTLNLIEDYLERNYIPGTNCLWERNTNYYRLDGSTHALEREKLINEFNANPHIYLFLVSTRAGSLGINLVGANRVIVFDASWNPCHDTQAVCRVYRYGQRKPCFVYRFVMDWCLEKKIYDRQINKQGMADRVVDECNPDAVLSMKEITNLCFDNDEKENEPKDLSEHKDKYIDVVMQKIIGEHGKLLSKEPFQHESLLVDRKEKKLSSAEKRLAQRGYELEKKAALQPKPMPAYRTVRTADGSIIQRPVASVRPMQHGARWIPADVWRRQGMTAQEMTLPLDVVIPTNSAERTNIVLKAGQRVMVLKSPKGIYMQLESGKIIAIKTSFKGLSQKTAENKTGENIVGKKVLSNRPLPVNLPGSLKNNSAITITPKPGVRPNLNRVLNRQTVTGQNKVSRLMPGQSFKPRPVVDPKSLLSMKSRLTPQGRVIRPNLNLTSSVSITKVVKKPNEESNDSTGSKTEASGEDTHVLDSEDEVEAKSQVNDNESNQTSIECKDNVQSVQHNNVNNLTEDSKSSNDAKLYSNVENITLTTDETLPSEAAFEEKIVQEEKQTSFTQPERPEKTSKISLLKNYRHQRQSSRPPIESSLSQLERTASVLNTEGMPDFRKNLDDITQSYSPGTDDRTASKSKKKKSPIKPDMPLSIENSERSAGSSMTHSVSNLLGNATSPKPPSRIGNDLNIQNTLNSNPIMQPRYQSPPTMAPHHPLPQSPHLGYPNKSYPGIMPEHPAMSKSPLAPSLPSGLSLDSVPGPVPSGYPPPMADNPYRQYPGYGVGYGAYPNPSFYSTYGAGYYPPYPGVPHAYPQPPSSVHPHVSHPPIGAPMPEHYPPNPQW